LNEHSWRRPRSRVALASALVVTAAAGAGGDGYPDYNAMTDRLAALLADHPDACELSSIGKTREGRRLWTLRLARGDGAADRTAMAIVAGVDGDFPAASETALRVAQRLLTAEPGSGGHELLSTHAVYVIPRVNPDAMEAFFQTPRVERRPALRPVDDDRDGLADEDGPDDVNGDGLITLMRVVDPEPTHLEDPAEPRLLREPDRAKGQRPVYKVYPEGIDDDGDEEYNEDGRGGVDLNRNFTHGYEEHAAGSGPHQISEPESKALIDFFLQHPRICQAVFYGRHDNVIKPAEGGKTDATGRAPTGLHKDDVDLYKTISQRYRQITEAKEAPGEPSNGAVFAWAYAQYGIPSFACRVWLRPEPKKPPEGEPEPGAAAEPGAPGEPAPGEPPPAEPAEPAEPAAAGNENDNDTEAPPPVEATSTESAAAGERAAAPAQEDAPPAAPKTGGDQPARPTEATPEVPPEVTADGQDAAIAKDRKEDEKLEPADKEAAAWLKVSDGLDGKGFVPWTPFEHPQLGPVEIGGFVPYFQTTPPDEELDGIADKQLEFVLDLAGRFPSVSWQPAKVTALSAGVFEIETALINDGYFPTALAIARDNRRVRPYVVTIDVPRERVLGGDPLVRAWSIPGSGGRQMLRWVIAGEPGAIVTIKAAAEKYGETTLAVALPSSTVPAEGNVNGQ